jgi:hypothetical protein
MIILPAIEFSFRDFLEQQQVPGGAFPMGRGKMNLVLEIS